MKFIADLHIHSHFSRATARNLDLENLYVAARIKGVTVVGTGDFTHPGWFAEIEEKLVPAEEGLFRLRDDLANACDRQVPGACRTPVRFLLSTEISNIYKKNGRTRKNHNLVFLPDMDTARTLNRRLDAIGNIRSDGRPILGLDARNLLEIVLETTSDGYLIPAHVWTPWFSLLGSKSGFDSVEECFGDLARHIFAVETGLSSDPPMNWRVSSLDGLTLVSNSDAHSPGKIGREANIFDTDLSYPALRDALATGDPHRFLGTCEFYPEEGKYHLDGHRKCGVRLAPGATMAAGGLCPECGKPLTLGVLYRVEELADRPSGEFPERRHPFQSLIPLDEVLAEVFGVGAGSKKVREARRKVVEKLGPELSILQDMEIDALDRCGPPLLGEAIRRMRKGDLHIQPGYDGEFGVVTIFSAEERTRLGGQQQLFAVKKPGADIGIVEPRSAGREAGRSVTAKSGERDAATLMEDGSAAGDLNADQRRAMEFKKGPLLIVAGPGTGKTLTLTRRIAHLINTRQVSPENMLAVTFTNKAAEGMRSRLGNLLPAGKDMPLVGTFHGVCLRFLTEMDDGGEFSVIDEDERAGQVSETIRLLEADGVKIPFTPRVLAERISLAKQLMLEPDDDLTPAAGGPDGSVFADAYRMYQRLLAIQEVRDYDDLVFDVVRRLETDPAMLETCRNTYSHVFVDEYQDINHGQYRLVRNLASGGHICAIGDPDQSIYGFRGSDVAYFSGFVEDFPDAEVIHLIRNYRSTETIIEAAFQVIRDQQRINLTGSRIYSGIGGRSTIGVLETATDKAEAAAIGVIIENMIGGIGMHSVAFGKTGDAPLGRERSFADFAVLFRTRAQGERIAEQFEKGGIPCQTAIKANRFGRRGVGLALSLLKLMHGRGAYGDLQRVLGAMGHGIGDKTIAAIKKWGFHNRLTAHQVLSDIRRFPVPGVGREKQLLMDEWIGRHLLTPPNEHDGELRRQLLRMKETIDCIDAFLATDPLDREAFDRLTDLAGKSSGDAPAFFAALSLDGDADVLEKGVEKVSLLTMHAAKGLEFPVVFIAGCEDGLIPCRRHGRESVDIEEEQRLFYVAMTRAREVLYLSRAGRRTLFGRTVNTEPSPFTANIASRLKACEDAGGRRGKRTPAQTQLTLF